MLAPYKNDPLAVADQVGAIPGLAKLWAETLGDPRICIAILDGPVELDHPAFVGANLTLLISAPTWLQTYAALARH